jgi:hypothetical protein
MAAVMSGFKDGRQVIVPVPLEFTGPQVRFLPEGLQLHFSQLLDPG